MDWMQIQKWNIYLKWICSQKVARDKLTFIKYKFRIILLEYV